MAPATVAAAPPAKQLGQAPGYFRMMVGDFEVTALSDGYIGIGLEEYEGASTAEMRRLLARAFQPTTGEVPTSVNAFLVHTGTNLVLVDAGSAACFGPTAGRLPESLRAAGYAPEQVDTVLLTHLHPDHVCGLLSADGTRAFPTADVYVSKAEADAWLSDKAAAEAPNTLQARLSKRARDAVAPYVAAGKLKLLQPGQALLPGVTPVPTHGHTSGHQGYLFTSGAERMLVWGDMVHNYALQLVRPDIAYVYDTDTRQALTSRKQVMARAARESFWVAAAHLPFPGIGHVRSEGKGYAWVPAEHLPVRVSRDAP